MLIPPLAAVITSMVATPSLVHGDRPAWLDRFLDVVSPSRGGNTRTRAAAGAAAADRGVRRGHVPLFLRHGRAQARRLSTIDTRFERARRPGAAAGRRAGRVRRRHVRPAQRAVAVPAAYHAKVIDAAQGRRGARRSPTTSSSPSRAESRPRRTSRTTTRWSEPSGRPATSCSSTTEVGAGGTTRVLGGGEALKDSRGDAPASTSYPTDADGRIRRMLFDQDGLESFPLAAVARGPGGKPVELPEGDSARDRVPGRARHRAQDPLQQRLRRDVPQVRRAREDRRRRRPPRRRCRTSTAPRPPATRRWPAPRSRPTRSRRSLDGFPLRPGPGG